MVKTTTGAARGVWGTWEELILGGAVLRHGPQAWDVISSELRARTVSPCSFTPEACKDKYDDLQKQYTGCTGLFEELKKRRVEHLKQELENGDEVIGSLELKLKSLIAENGNSNHGQVHHDSCETNPPPTSLLKPEHMESSFKETSNEVKSASSISKVIKTAVGMELKQVVEFSKQKTSPTVEKLGEKVKIVQKTKGVKRKRKDNNNRDIQQICQSENLGSTAVAPSTITACDQTTLNNNDLLELFDSISQITPALENQETMNYRDLMTLHMKYDMIKSKIASSKLQSMAKLFSDKMLATTNTLALYLGKMPEDNSAVLLRTTPAESYEQHFNKTNNILSSFDLPLSPIYNPPSKPRTPRPRTPRSVTPHSNINNFFLLASQEHKKGGTNTHIVEKTPKRRIAAQTRRKANCSVRVPPKKQDGTSEGSDEQNQVTNHHVKRKKRARKM